MSEKHSCSPDGNQNLMTVGRDPFQLRRLSGAGRWKAHRGERAPSISTSVSWVSPVGALRTNCSTQRVASTNHAGRSTSLGKTAIPWSLGGEGRITLGSLESGFLTASSTQDSGIFSWASSGVNATILPGASESPPLDQRAKPTAIAKRKTEGRSTCVTNSLCEPVHG